MKKWKLWMLLSLIVTVVMGIYIVQMSKQQKIQAFQKQASMQFVHDMSVVEYGDDVLELAFIKQLKGRIADYEEVNSLAMGYQQIRFTLVVHDAEYGIHKKDYYYTVKAEDTNPPILIFKKEQVELAYGASFDPKSNVSECRDIVDGKLSFTVAGEVDSKKPGTYRLFVQAMDRNELMTVQSFEVVVSEPIVVEEVVAHSVYDRYQKCASAGYSYWKQNRFQGTFRCSIMPSQTEKGKLFVLECYDDLAKKC